VKDLRDLQQRFADYLHGGGGDVPATVIGDDNADARERMDLYAGAYRARLVDSLGVDFPGLWTMLGDEQFYQLCLDYIRRHPSSYPSIRWFGNRLPEFLRQNAPYNEYPQVAEMAAFEWAQGLVFDARDAAAVSLETLAEVSPQEWADMCLEFVPAMQRLDLSWNIPLLWSAIDRKEDPMPELEQQGYPVGWLLWRQDLVPGWRRLDVDEAWALDQAREGECFGNICEGLLEWVDEQNAPVRAAGFIKTWVSHRLIGGLRFD
jgi:hypothetical protein